MVQLLCFHSYSFPNNILKQDVFVKWMPLAETKSTEGKYLNVLYFDPARSSGTGDASEVRDTLMVTYSPSLATVTHTVLPIALKAAELVSFWNYCMWIVLFYIKTLHMAKLSMRKNFHYKGIDRRAAWWGILFRPPSIWMGIIFTSKVYQLGIFITKKVFEWEKCANLYLNGYNFRYGKYMNGSVRFFFNFDRYMNGVGSGHYQIYRLLEIPIMRGFPRGSTEFLSFFCILRWKMRKKCGMIVNKCIHAHKQR